MIGTAKKLVQFLEGSDKRFLIPVYQRNYEWHEPQCKQLFNDLEEIAKKNKENHFFGSFVSINYGGGYEFQIIDGQQRITTISILMLALFHLLDKKEIKSDSEHLKSRLMEDYLVDKYQPREKRIKLKTTSNNQEFYSKLFSNPGIDAKTSNVVNNFNYFLSRIRNSTVSADDLFNSIRKLIIIDIIISENDDPQRIFESINSTGLDLSESDKIRNFLLMNLKPDQQEYLYDNYWKIIEKNCLEDSQKVSMFIRDYLTIKTGYIPKIGSIYYEFKEFFEKEEFERSELMKELSDYSKWYNVIITSEYRESKRVSYALRRINQIEATVTFPFILELFMMLSENQIDKKSLYEILEVIETFLFRRWIVDLTSNALNKIFATLHKEINKHLPSGDNRNYKEVLNHLLLSKKGNFRFPNNDEFIEGLRTKDIYLLNQKNKHYLFEKLENRDSVEHVNVYDMLKDGVLTIEHIMPQTLSDDWILELGDNYHEIHEKWLHKLANLTLTGYNSKYSNHSFQVKKSMDKGFLDSNLKLNEYLKSIDQWTLDEMEIREDKIIKLALKTWPMIKTDFEDIRKLPITLSLVEDSDLSYFSITEYSLFDETQLVDNWKDFYMKVITQVYRMNQVKFINSINENEYLKNYVNHPTLACFEIDKDLTFAYHMSTNSMLNILRTLFDSLNIDQNELTYSVVNGKNSDTEKTTLWKKIKPDFEEKVMNALGYKGKFVTRDKMNVYEIMSERGNFRIKLSYSLNYESSDPKYRGNGWFILPKSIRSTDFSHLVFAVYNEMHTFDYVLFNKDQFIETFSSRFKDQNKNLNIYIGVTKDDEAFERRFAENLMVLTDELNNWAILQGK
jgi:uncharacterized protein with ParB-like and HNH nuclease domain